MDLDQRLADLGQVVAAEIQPGMLLGLGTGSTADAFLRALAQRVQTGLTVSGVASSVRTENLAKQLGIPLRSVDEVGRLDLGVDGADEIDPRLNLIKGAGGALLREKLVAYLCEQFVVIAASEKLVDHLGTRLPLPVEVVPFSWKQTAARLRAIGLKPVLRCNQQDANAPFLTDGGHFILDCTADPGVLDNPAACASNIKSITGVVEHGIFAEFADRAMIVEPDGQIKTIRR